MLNTKYESDRERPPQPEPVTGRDDVIHYFMCDDADAAYREVQSKGWKQLDEPRTPYYGLRQTYLRDPDGFHLACNTP